MRDFAGKIAVVTGGGTGMGRELARKLVAEGCNVAMCDVFAETMAETKRLCEAERLPQGLRITTHIADVSDEAQVLRFRVTLLRSWTLTRFISCSTTLASAAAVACSPAAVRSGRKRST